MCLRITKKEVNISLSYDLIHDINNCLVEIAMDNYAGCVLLSHICHTCIDFAMAPSNPFHFLIVLTYEQCEMSFTLCFAQVQVLYPELNVSRVKISNQVVEGKLINV